MFYVAAWFYSLMWMSQPIYIGPFVDQQACIEGRQAHGVSSQAGDCFEGLDVRAYAQGGVNDDRGFRGLWVVTGRADCRLDDSDGGSVTR